MDNISRRNFIKGIGLFAVNCLLSSTLPEIPASAASVAKDEVATGRKFTIGETFEVILRNPKTKEIIAYMDDCKLSGNPFDGLYDLPDSKVEVLACGLATDCNSGDTHLMQVQTTVDLKQYCESCLNTAINSNNTTFIITI